jgi:mono/diheme cytochrome c family protein
MNNGAMGRIDGPNLTRGQGGVPATFSDTDWERAIRHGIATNGRGLFLMPSTDYAQFSAEDMGALIAYLKSLPPVDHPRVPVALGPVSRALLAFGKIKLAADEIDHASLKPMTAKPGETAEYGHYLAISCTGCHGPNLSGGKIAAGPPEWPPAANLTPDPSGRLGKWTEANFLQVLRTAKRPDGTELHPAMPRAFGQMTETELKALWLYIKTLPAAATGSR